MKRILIHCTLLLMALCHSGTLRAGRLDRRKNPPPPKVTDDDVAFIERHILRDKKLIATANALFGDPAVMEAILSQNYDQLNERGFHVFAGRLRNLRGNMVLEHPDLPGWIIKFGPTYSQSYNTILRITRVEEIQKYLDEKGFTHVKLPTKKLYHLPGKGRQLLNENWAVFCEKIESPYKLDFTGGDYLDGIAAVFRAFTGQRLCNKTSLPDETIDELKQVILNTRFCDSNWSNMKLLEDGKTIVLIDTEPLFEFQNKTWENLENLCIRRIKTCIAIGSLGKALATGERKSDPKPKKRREHISMVMS